MTGARPIHHRLWFRLTASFLLVALVGVAVVAALANLAARNEFSRFLSAEEGSAWRVVLNELGALYEA